MTDLAMTDLAMTDLATRLRALADDCKRARQTSFAEGPDYEVTEEALREAADALTLQDEALASWSALQDKWHEERHALKAKLAASEHEAHLIGIVRDKAMAKLAEAETFRENAEKGWTDTLDKLVKMQRERQQETREHVQISMERDDFAAAAAALREAVSRLFGFIRYGDAE